MAEYMQDSDLQENISNISKSVKYAGFLVRLVAYIIDLLILYIIDFVIILILVLFGFFSKSVLFLNPDMLINYTYLLLVIILQWLYESYFLSSLYMATPGKILLGLKVMDLDNNRISFSKATVRYFFKAGAYLLIYWLIILPYINEIQYIKIISLVALISPLFILFTEKKQAFHDLIAGTIIIYNEIYI